MSASSTWKPAYDFTYTDNGVAVLCTECSMQEQIGTFDTSNQTSGGYSEFGVDVKTYNVRGTAIIDTAAVAMPSFASLVPITFNDGISSFSGSGRITSRERTGAGRGGFRVPFQGTFTGTVVVA